jgi:hypothetical protein
LAKVFIVDRLGFKKAKILAQMGIYSRSQKWHTWELAESLGGPAFPAAESQRK